MSRNGIKSSADFQSASETLPEGWVMTTLGEIVVASPEKMDPSSDPSAPYVGLEHIESGTKRLLSVGKAADVRSAKSVFLAGDILYGKLRPYLNKIVRPTFAGVCSTDILVIRATPQVEPVFIEYVMSMPRFTDFAMSNSAGINLPRTSYKKLADFPIALPPLAEQRRIVARLEALEARSRRARAKLAAVPAQLAQARQSLLAAAFRGELTADWRSERGHTSVWSESTLNALLTSMRNGISVKPEGDEGLPILRISAVRPLELNLNDRRFLSATAVTFADYHLNEGDLLFTRYNGNAELVGACAVVPCTNEIVVYPDKLIRVRLNLEITTPDFIAAAVSCGISRLHIANCAKTAAGQVGISGKDLKQTPIPLPPLPEQREIVRRLRAAFARLDAVARTQADAVATIDRLDQSLLARAFSGQLVPQAEE
jgi:type I restriction enzyme S subunit